MPTTTKTQKGSALAATSEAPTCEPPAYDPAAGREALDALAPALDALVEADFVTLRVDIETATYAALGVVGFVTSPEVHARFALLPEECFDMSHVDGLGPACFAMLYALAEARAAGALETEARLPAALADEAAEVEGRMQALCEYHFADEPAIKPLLDRLRPGVGHRDLANDLLGYARIYELRADLVQADRTNYRAGDAARAKALAGMMIQKLSSAMTPRARTAYDRYVRVWTLLNRRYNEVRAAGLWLFRDDPRVQQRFPSLFAAGRPNGGRPRKDAAKGTQSDAQHGASRAAEHGAGGGTDTPPA
jgi:hypothetical protein